MLTKGEEGEPPSCDLEEEVRLVRSIDSTLATSDDSVDKDLEDFEFLRYCRNELVAVAAAVEASTSDEEEEARTCELQCSFRSVLDSVDPKEDVERTKGAFLAAAK